MVGNSQQEIYSILTYLLGDFLIVLVLALVAVVVVVWRWQHGKHNNKNSVT